MWFALLQATQSKPTSNHRPSSAASSCSQPQSPLTGWLLSDQRASRVLTDIHTCRAWGAAESKVASDYSSKYKPFPIPEDPLFTSKDVSVVALLLSPPKLFEKCLKSWLRNQPREVILVTTFDHCKHNPRRPAGAACFCPLFATY